jgi:Fe-Mn family superoxide dismutase
MAMAGGLAGAADSAAGSQLGTVLYPGAVENGKYVLPPLPYAYDALEPYIDEETMRLHHDRHHQGYVNGLIAAEEGLAEARRSGDWSRVEHLAQKSAFHGAGHFLHSIFWQCMAPEGKRGEPSAALARAIERDVGSMEACREQFFNTAKTVEGSGWGLLTWSIPARKLVILQARNHQYATQWANVPLLVVDVWEHAYYKKYGPARGDYIKAFMEVIDWPSVSGRFQALSES